MFVIVKGRKLNLQNAVVRKAKVITSEFLDKVNKESSRIGRPDMYITTLLVMHTISADLLEDIDADTFELLFDKFKKLENIKTDKENLNK